MGWSIGTGANGRDIGYGVPAYCDHPKCNRVIDRGLSYLCGGTNWTGSESGCGLYFCPDHLSSYSENKSQCCPRCGQSKDPYRPKADHPRWIHHKYTDPSWAKWRAEQAAKWERWDNLGEEAVA